MKRRNLLLRACALLSVFSAAVSTAHGHQVERVGEDSVVLSAGAQDGIREGATGRIIARDVVGGSSVEVVLALYRISRVEPGRSVAVLIKGRIGNLAVGMEAIFDQEQRPMPAPGRAQIRAPETGAYAHLPSGAFVMGCSPVDPECDSDERPAHSVIISRDFEFAVFETTNAEYRRCVRAGRCSPPKESPHLFDNPIYDDVPVLGVTWEQASGYCGFVGGRLPTEAEWEYAALGGSRSPRIYPWGETSPSCWSEAPNGARFDDDKRCDDSGPAVVGSFSPNEYGLFDLAGNAWEWTADFYDPQYYTRSERRDPTGPPNGNSRVVRGGAWSSSAMALRISNRLQVRNGGTSANIGFRCAREVSR